MKILITGATGYLGSFVADYLIRQGYDIRLTARNTPDFMKEWFGQFEFLTGDVADSDFCSRVSKGIDFILHFAALNEVECDNFPEMALRVNGIGTYNMLCAASKNSIKRFYYISTFHVYGIPETDTITEDTPVLPLSHYAISHYVAERYCEQFFLKKDLHATILRISNGYGAPLFKEIDRWSLVLNDFCRSAISKKEITLKTKGTQQRDFISLGDISRAIQILIDGPENQHRLFNIGGENPKSIRELADMVIAVCKRDFDEKVELKFAEPLLETAQEKNFTFNISRIKRLGFNPQSDMEKEIHKLIELCYEFKTN